MFPPIIGYNQTNLETKEEGKTDSKQKSEFNIFAFVMPGLIAVFLLFGAEGASRELFTERRNKTLDRFRTFSIRLTPFLVAKALYGVFVVLITSLIMLIGGALFFGIVWQHLFALSCVTVSYSLFCVGFAHLLVAVIFDEKTASMLNTLVIMLIGFLGGSMMPPQNFPAFIRDSISPWMPNYIFAESIKRLQFDFNGPHWAVASGQLLMVGLIMLALATVLIQRRLRAGTV